MTERQRIALQADWWPAAARAQGWKTGDRDLRLRVCAWAVSLLNPSQAELLEAINSDRTPERWLASTNDLDNKADVDRVKACLGMLADDLNQTAEVGQPQFGSARRKRDLIRSQLKCLALFEEHPRRYLQRLVCDLFNHGLPGLTIRDLSDVPKASPGRKSPSPLDRLVMRLAAIVNQKRNENVFAPVYAHLNSPQPLTIHEMKWEAGVPCDCSACKALRAHGRAPILPPLPAEEDWGDFDPELEPASDDDCELGAGISDDSTPF